MNRRTFIFAGAGAGVLSAQPPPSRQVVVGLIGAGARGSQLLRACLADNGVRIGAVCETFEPRMFEAVALARSRGHRTRYYRIYRDLIADDDLDAVVIATPDFWHHRMTLEALTAGKDVYVEQPLCRTWQEGVELLTAESATRQIVQVGSQLRSSPVLGQGGVHPRTVEGTASASYLRPDVLRRGGFKLREPLNFVDWQAAAEAQVAYSPDRFLNWRFYSAYGGGCVTELGTRVVDGIHILAGLGFPESVQATGVQSTEPGFDTAERAAIIVRYREGPLVTLAVDGAAKVRREVIDVDGGINGSAQRIDLNQGADPTGRHLAKFFASVRTRKAPNAPMSLAFPATLVCQMANLSMGAGRAVRWDGTRVV
jgi:predicted dehydrogenase